MSKKLFNEEDDFIDDSVDDMEIYETKATKGKASKVLIPVAVAGMIALLFGGASLGLSAYQNAKLQKDFDKAVESYINSGDVRMAEQIEEALDAYANENQPTNIKDLVGEEGAKDLMDSIISDLGETELTDMQREQLKDILVELFSKDGAITVSGKAVFARTFDNYKKSSKSRSGFTKTKSKYRAR